MRVWVTRAAPGAAVTAARLRALGHVPTVASLLDVRRVDPEIAAPPEDTGALAFTSTNAVRAFAAWSPQRDLAVFAVGDATAAAARELGFARVDSAQGDVAALARLIAAHHRGGAILHPCARAAAGDLAGDLAGSGPVVRSVILYETVAVAPPSAAAVAWTRGELEAVLLHSPKAARALAAWLQGLERQRPPCAAAIGLSPACLAPLPAGRFTRLRAAAEPTEAALLSQLA